MASHLGEVHPKGPSEMTTTHRILLGVASLAAAAFLLPIAFPALWSYGGTGYFDRGRCACGHPIYVRLVDDGCYDYSPGHGVPEHRAFTVRPNGKDWDMYKFPDPDLGYFSQIGETGLVAHVWIEKGQLCERWSGRAPVVRYSRVYNPWPIWCAKILNE